MVVEPEKLFAPVRRLGNHCIVAGHDGLSGGVVSLSDQGGVTASKRIGERNEVRIQDRQSIGVETGMRRRRTDAARYSNETVKSERSVNIILEQRPIAWNRRQIGHSGAVGIDGNGEENAAL